jgi:hypothetical protein
MYNTNISAVFDTFKFMYSIPDIHLYISVLDVTCIICTY